MRGKFDLLQKGRELDAFVPAALRPKRHEYDVRPLAIKSPASSTRIAIGYNLEKGRALFQLLSALRIRSSCGALAIRLR